MGRPPLSLSFSFDPVISPRYPPPGHSGPSSLLPFPPTTAARAERGQLWTPFSPGKSGREEEVSSLSAVAAAAAK